MQDGTEKAADRGTPRAQSGEAETIALHEGTRLHEAEIVDLIGCGEYSIVYLAYDYELGRHVALKEYMPSAIASRNSDASVSAKSPHHGNAFTAGLRHFVKEAKLFSQLDSASLLKVYRFWEENGTAYMAMPVYEGITLEQAFKAQPVKPSEGRLRELLTDLLDAVEAIHRVQDCHGDITSDSIMLQPDGRALLLDFNAARTVISHLAGRASNVPRPGFAPIEQYPDMPGLKQGAWTDIYALGAVMYYLINGKAPPAAMSRMINDNMVPAREVGRGSYSEDFLAVLDRALAVRPEQRIRSVADLREALRPDSVTSGAVHPTSIYRDNKDNRGKRDNASAQSMAARHYIPNTRHTAADDRPPDWYQKGKRNKAFASSFRQTKPTMAVASLVLVGGIAVGIYAGINYSGPSATHSTPPIVARAEPAASIAPSAPSTPATSAPDPASSTPAPPPLSRQDTQPTSPLPASGGLEDQEKSSAKNSYPDKPDVQTEKNAPSVKLPGPVAESKPGIRTRPAPVERSKPPAPTAPTAPQVVAQQPAAEEIPPQAKFPDSLPDSLPDSDTLKKPQPDTIPRYPAERETSGELASSPPLAPPPDASPKPVLSQADTGDGKEIKLDDQTMQGDFSLDPVTGAVSGRGSITWKNGDRFEGTLVKGSKEGKGIFVWKNGNRYSGDWANNQPNGRGTLEFRNGDQYKGEVRNGVPNGKGSFVFSNGNRYEGEVKNSSPNGKGMLVFADGTRYEGEVKDGVPNGQGVTRFRHGDVYSGTVVAGKSHGRGRYTWANGTVWEGEFRNDQRTENGSIVTAGGKYASTPDSAQSARIDTRVKE
jgi:serine/threonine protein kinase